MRRGWLGSDWPNELKAPAAKSGIDSRNILARSANLRTESLNCHSRRHPWRRNRLQNNAREHAKNVLNMHVHKMLKNEFAWPVCFAMHELQR